MPLSGLCILIVLFGKMPTWLLKYFYLVEKKQVMAENKSPIMEATIDDSTSASLDNRKEKEESSLKEKDDNDRKQASPSTAAPQTKPAKRRITPMAID